MILNDFDSSGARFSELGVQVEWLSNVNLPLLPATPHPSPIQKARICTLLWVVLLEAGGPDPLDSRPLPPLDLKV